MVRSVLLVDQKQSTAELVKTYLTADGYEVDHTPDPSKAVEYASRSQYGVVVTDLVMRGGMSGIDLYREIRSYDVQVRFVFMLVLSADVLRLMGSLERSDVIKKEPLSMNEVICKVRAAFTNSR
ncbi:response regulator with CheY-like receiver domain and winged-helix DNA-binding domain [Candidatus Nitrososphaera evergladensis SR1]|uniref:Response regulator with CheY-like receiver domain and winged-helix DNA-binding domain n=1 Tax=Candidatus Nitrososphaera evergladensis SR1 TaxID=1459636 RepID=A0A075MRZ0_9ARCH|nr:response regulator [Candidatus Nitrososphaera evergladensis]AIF82174.1 response regulator with CheY-like receiver domain and winged-helix DNA-binding domain [Candidatus Nitrososphaera evergladensis SR1]